MPMSRVQKNVLRKAKSPVAGTKAQGCGPCGDPVKQYKQSGKKYNGPNYPQKGSTDTKSSGGK